MAAKKLVKTTVKISSPAIAEVVAVYEAQGYRLVVQGPTSEGEGGRLGIIEQFLTERVREHELTLREAAEILDSCDEDGPLYTFEIGERITWEDR